MATKLFVGSLSFGVDDNQLKDFFSSVGEVTSATVITERDSGRSKGFGFVEMASDDEAKEAIKSLNDKELDGRAIKVSEARPREDRGPSNFNRSRGGSYNKNRY